MSDRAFLTCERRWQRCHLRSGILAYFISAIVRSTLDCSCFHVRPQLHGDFAQLIDGKVPARFLCVYRPFFRFKIICKRKHDRPVWKVVLFADSKAMVTIYNHHIFVCYNRCVATVFNDVCFQKKKLLIRQWGEQLFKIGANYRLLLSALIFDSGIFHYVLLTLVCSFPSLLYSYSIDHFAFWEKETPHHTL